MATMAPPKKPKAPPALTPEQSVALTAARDAARAEWRSLIATLAESPASRIAIQADLARLMRVLGLLPDDVEHHVELWRLYQPARAALDALPTKAERERQVEETRERLRREAAEIARRQRDHQQAGQVLQVAMQSAAQIEARVAEIARPVPWLFAG